MTPVAILHLVLHAAVPAAVAVLLSGRRWRRAWLVMMATMAVDLDHLLADPVYDPSRCSIGFHLLHRPPWFVLYALLALWPSTRLLGLGLLLHMGLDFSDCVLQRGLADATARLTG